MRILIILFVLLSFGINHAFAQKWRKFMRYNYATLAVGMVHDGNQKGGKYHKGGSFQFGINHRRFSRIDFGLSFEYQALNFDETLLNNQQTNAGNLSLGSRIYVLRERGYHYRRRPFAPFLHANIGYQRIGHRFSDRRLRVGQLVSDVGVGTFVRISTRIGVLIEGGYTNALKKGTDFEYLLRQVTPTAQSWQKWNLKVGVRYILPKKYRRIPC